MLADSQSLLLTYYIPRPSQSSKTGLTKQEEEEKQQETLATTRSWFQRNVIDSLSSSSSAAVYVLVCVVWEFHCGQCKKGEQEGQSTTTTSAYFVRPFAPEIAAISSLTANLLLSVSPYGPYLVYAFTHSFPVRQPAMRRIAENAT